MLIDKIKTSAASGTSVLKKKSKADVVFGDCLLMLNKLRNLITVANILVVFAGIVGAKLTHTLSLMMKSDADLFISGVILLTIVIVIGPINIIIHWLDIVIKDYYKSVTDRAN